MASIALTSRGVLVDGRGRASVRMATAMRRWLGGVLRRVRDDVRDYAPVDTGRFRRSVRYRTHQRGAIVFGVVESTEPAIIQNVIEHGRRPGAPMPPSGVLLGWMARHGIPAKQEFVLRRSIGVKGIRARAPFGKAIKKNAGLLRSQHRQLATVIIRELEWT